MPTPSLSLTASEVAGIKFALDVLAQRLSEVTTQPLGVTEMSGLSQPMASLFDFETSLRQDWTQPLQASLPGAQTVTSLISGIQAAVAASGLVSISQIVDSLEVSGASQTLWLDITLDVNKTLVDYALDLGLSPSGDPANPSPGDKGLWVSPIKADVEASLAGHIRVGICLDPGLPIDQAIRFQIDNLELGAAVNALVQDVQARYGIFSLGQNEASVAIDSRLKFDLVEGATGYVTLGALATQGFTDLFAVQTAGTGMTVDLPFTLDVAGFTQSGTTQHLLVRATDGFDATGLDIELPAIDLTGASSPFDFSKFTQISVNDLGNYLTGLQDYLPDFASGAVAPLLNKSFSEVLTLNAPLDGVIQALRDPDTGGWSFHTVQEMIAAITAQLGVQQSVFALRWSALADSIEWDLPLHYEASINEAFDADAIVPAGSVVKVSGKGAMTIDADLDLTLSGGIAVASSANMNPITPTTLLSQLNGGYGLTTTGLLGTNNDPKDDIGFSLRNGTSIGFDLNTLALGSGALPGTATVQDLLALFNAPLSPISASLANNQLTIIDLTTGPASFSVWAPSLTVTVGQGIAASPLHSISVAPLVLGLSMLPQQPDQITGLSLESLDPRDRLYLVAQPVVNGTLDLSATLEGGAALGPLALQIVDGELEAHADWTLTLIDPATGANDGRLYFSEIVDTLQSGVVNAVDSMMSSELATPALQGTFQLQITPDALSTTLAIDLADYSQDPVDLANGSPLAPDTNLVPYIEVTLSGTGLDGGWGLSIEPSVKLSAILDNAISAFSWDDLPALLDLLITQLEGTALWQAQIPLTGQSVGELLSLRSGLSGLVLPILADYIEPGIGNQVSTLDAAFAAALSDFTGNFADMRSRIENLDSTFGQLELAWSGRTPGDASFEGEFLGRINAWRSDLRGVLTGLDAALAAPTPPASLTALSAALHSALGFADAIPSGLDALTALIEHAFEDNIPGMNVTIAPSFIPNGNQNGPSTGRLDFGIHVDGALSGTFDLGAIALSAGTVLDITGSGNLAYALTGSIDTHVGWDFGTLAPTFDLAGTSAALQLSVDDGAGLVLNASLGGLATVAIGSADPGRQMATIELRSTEYPADPAHPLPAEFHLAGDGSLTGAAYFAAHLPVYVDPIAGVDPVASIDVTANLVIVSIPTPSFSFEPVITVDPTDLSSIFEQGTLGINGWIEGAIVFVHGLRTGLESDLLDKLPFIGNIDLSSSGFLADLEGVLQTLAAYDTPGELVTAVNAGLGAFGSVSFTMGGEALTTASDLWTMPIDQIYKTHRLDLTDELIANLDLHGSVNKTFDAGVLDLNLDSLGIGVSGNAGIDFALDAGLNIDLGWSPGGGFFLQGVAGDELTASVGLGFTPGSELTVNLGPLDFSLTDGTPGLNDYANKANREFNADIAIDLGTGKLTGDTGSGLFANATFALTDWHAQLDLDLTAKLSDAGVGLGASLLIGYAMPAAGSSFDDLSSGQFSFAITDTFIDLGDLVGAPVVKAIDSVKKAFEPLQPVLELLGSDVPLISDLSQQMGSGPVTFVDAIGMFGDGGESAAKLLGVMLAINDTANSFGSGPGDSLRFSLGGLTPSNPASLLGNTALDSSAFVADPGTGSPPDTASGLGGTFGNALSTLQDIGLSFPILDHPGDLLFDLLFGRDATLIYWDVPDLHASFDFRQTFAIYPPLYVTLFGGVSFDTNFDLGYDTHGIRQFVDAGSDNNDGHLLLNGLFLADNPGNELKFTAIIGAGAELNVVVAQAGVEGGLIGQLGADLKDPNSDSKVHLDEFLHNLQLGPECIFDFNGSLSVFLAAYIKIGLSTPLGFVELFSERFNLADKTLFDWSLVTCPPVDPKLAVVEHSFDHDADGTTAHVGALVLNLGSRAHLVVPGDTYDGNEVFTVDIHRNEDATPHADGGLTVTGYAFSQSFSAAELTGVTWISFDGGVGKDSVIITPDVTLSVWGHGGDGNDELIGGSGSNVLFGDTGSDMLVGRLGADVLYGGVGDDFLYGYGGTDLLDGGSGADAIYGDDELGNMAQFNVNNPAFNGGADGADSILGGEGDDRIAAGGGNDHVEGDAGNDQILGDAGDDMLWGDDQAGSVTQGSATLNADKIQGGSGFNQLWGGPGNDLLYAADEVQLALAPAVVGSPSGWSSMLYGGDGADMLYGTAGADRLEGGLASDYIASGADADLLLGGPGNDALIAAGGNATLLGGHGDDVMDGGAGQNWIEGGPGNDDIYAREGADTVYGGSTALGYDYLLADLAGPAAVVDPLHGGFQSTVSADGCAPVIYFYPEVYAPTFGPLTGEIFFDMNRNSLREGNEPLVPAGQQWHVVLTDVTRTVTLMDATFSNSALSLDQGGVPAGDYWIVLSPLAGNTWLPTNSTSSVQALVSVDSSGALSVPQFGYYKTDAKSAAALGAAPEAPTGVAATGLKSMALGLTPTGDASVSGRVWWHDVNDPALGRSLSEPGIAGQTIELLEPAGTVVATAVTDVSGNYAFNGLLAGTYTVRQAPELPWRQVVAEGAMAEQTWLSAQVSNVNNAVSNLELLDFSTARATWVAELPLQVRDLALVGQNDVYLSGTVLGAMGSTNGLWHYDLQTRDLQQLGDSKLGQAPEMLALDVLDATHLLGLSAAADVYNFDIGSEVWSRVGTLRDNAGQALQTIGDVALVSPGQAFAVVALASAMGGEVPPDSQLLVSFDPASAEITRGTAPLRIQNAPTLFIGLEWDGTSLKALGQDGQTYTIDPAQGMVQHDAVLAGMAPGPWGGLAWSASDLSLMDKDGTFTVTLGDGQTATIGFGDKPDGIVLPDGNDRIDGGCGPEADLLYGDDGLNLPANVITLGGYDTIRGRDGDDTIDGGKKGDVLSGDAGNDLIIGGRESSNIVNGGDGQDTLTGGPAADVILGGAGNDTLNGLAGDDWQYGEAGNDSLVGGLDNDLLVGGAGTDTSSGGAGDDQLVVINTDLGGLYGDNPAGIEGDLYDGGAGVDSIVVVADTSLVLTTGSLTLSGAPTDVIVSIEQSWLKGGASPNLLDASAFDGRSWIFGEGANDTLRGGSGADWIDGGGNDDTLTGGQGNDTLLGGAGSNTMTAGSADDLYVIDAASSTNLLTEAAGAGSDTVDLTGVATSLNVDLGQGGGRHLNVDSTVSAGPDVDGSTGEFETILLGSGHDSVRVATAIGAGMTVDAGAGTDTLDYSGASNGNAWSAPVIVDLGAGLATGLGAANAFENVLGGSGNDTLTGSAGPNLLNGGPGNDVLSGQDGADTLLGGNGSDALYGGDGDDVMQGQSGQNTLEGGSGDDVYLLPDVHFADQVTERLLSSDGFDTLDFSGQSQDMVLTLTNSMISVALADDSLLAAQEAQGLEVILGGSGRDWFLMAAGTSLPNVLLDGGRTASAEFTDANELDYRSFNTPVSVDLQDVTNLTESSIGSATGTHGVVNLRHIFGGSGDDTLLGGNLAVWFESGDGNDMLVGSIQDDLLYGGAGEDTVKGGDGNDEIIAGDGAGNDSYDGGRGVDTVHYSSATTPITVNLAQGFASGHEIGEDRLLNIENIMGGQAADTLSGDDNANRIDGGNGNDALDGGLGIDTAVYFGNRSAYVISVTSGGFTVSSAADGMDTLTGIEFVQFADQSIPLDLTAPTISTGTANSDTLTGDTGRDALSGLAGNDTLTGLGGNDALDGGEGTDTALFSSRHAAYTLSSSAGGYSLSGPDGSDSLTSMERLQFLDATLAFDTSGNAGQTYRLYQAAFNRTPDLTGLGGWIGGMDDGLTLSQVASSFMASAEFQFLYGANPSNEQFVSLLYTNALHRTADAGGLAYWVNQLVSGLQTRAQALVNLSESPENQEAVAAQIANGILYVSTEQSAVAQGQAFVGTSGADSLIGSVSNDSFQGGAGDDNLNGGVGIDSAIYSGSRASHGITPGSASLTVSGGTDGTDTLTQVERVRFDDVALAFDTSGNAGQTYRLYQAAFDRTPDTPGLSDWIRGMDTGVTLSQVATGFIGSAEFQGLYGANPSNTQFIDLLYANVLHRAPDQDGSDYWLGQMAGGTTRETVLIGFSESEENQAALIGVIENGIAYTAV